MFQHHIIINSEGFLTKNTNFTLKSRIIANAISLHNRLNYQSIARKAFIVESLPQGALPSYNNTIIKNQHNNVIISSDGKLHQKNKTFIKKVSVPLFEVVEYPTINISDVINRRFDIIDKL